MSTLSISLIIAVIVIGTIATWLLVSRRRTHHLRSKFGTEYERSLSEYGNRAKAELELTTRELRVERLSLRPVPAATRDRFLQTWREEQARFVDNPESAALEADRLVTEVMVMRGYPVADFEQKVQDISVDHPHLAQNYRVAHEIVLRQQRGGVSTEDLRRALVHYRALFDELLDMEEMSR